jgi:hypothetical protein
MKLIVQIAIAIILADLCMQGIHLLEAAAAVHAVTDALPTATTAPVVAEPRQAVLPPVLPVPLQVPARKPCQITTQDGVTHFCAGALTD